MNTCKHNKQMNNQGRLIIDNLLTYFVSLNRSFEHDNHQKRFVSHNQQQAIPGKKFNNFELSFRRGLSRSMGSNNES
jgi:hypothetical protein